MTGLLTDGVFNIHTSGDYKNIVLPNYIFIIDNEGNYLQDNEGNYLVDGIKTTKQLIDNQGFELIDNQGSYLLG